MFAKKSFPQQLLSTLSIYCTSFICGLATTWLQPTTRLLVRTEFDDQMKDSILTSLESLTICGRLTCSVICFLFVNNVARRSFIVSSVVMHSITWCLLTVIFDIRQLLMYQFMFGIGIAFHDIISFIYLAEVSSPRYRPFFIVCDLFFYALGVESCILVDSIGNFSILCAAALTLAIITISVMYYTLESPYYLMMREKESEAMFNLSVLNSGNTPDQVINLFKDLEKYANEEKSDNIDFYKSATKRNNLKILLFVILINVAAYIDLSEVFRRGHKPNDFHFFLNFQPLQMMIMSLFGILFAVIPTLIFKQRFLLLSGLTLAAFFQMVAALLFYVEDTDYNIILLSTYSQIKVILPILLFAIYISIIYPIVCTLRGEMFPYAMKIRGNALIEIFHLGIPLALNFAISPVTTLFGVGFTYAFHSVLSWLTVAYVHMYYRETKNLSLLQIRDLYKM